MVVALGIGSVAYYQTRGPTDSGDQRDAAISDLKNDGAMQQWKPLACLALVGVGALAVFGVHVVLRRPANPDPTAAQLKEQEQELNPNLPKLRTPPSRESWNPR